MAVPIVMPKLGLTMETGTVAAWHKREGERVEKGETIVEVETDKIVSEVQSPASGTLLKVLVPEGAEAKVQTLLAVIGEPGEDLAEVMRQHPSSRESRTSDESAPRPGAEVARAGDASGAGGRSGQRRITPRARKMLADHGLSPSALDSLTKERITEADVAALLAERAAAGGGASEGQGRPEELQPLSTIEKRTAQRMAESFRDIPQFSIRFAARVDRLLEQTPVWSQENGTEISINDLFLRAVAIALTRSPEVQYRYRPEGISRPSRINVGFAVALGRELVVPVISDADKRGIGDISREAKRLLSRAKEHKLLPDDIAGGTFTVSNLGMYGITSFVPIVNPGEAAILGIGGVHAAPFVENGAITAGRSVELTLVCDHRSVNGAIAAEFCRTLQTVIEAEELTSW